MVRENQLYLRKIEYSLRVPKVPRQSVEVFARDTKQGNYGLPAEVVDTVFEYARLQQTLNFFDDLTFSEDFLTRLPEDFRKKLDQNLYPGIPLANLEIPTTDKVLLAELLIADALTDSLSKSPVEVWITPDIQKKLESLNCTVEIGLQQIDYSQLSLEVKHFLVGVMEYQEMQVHTVLLAHKRFPDGVPAVLGFRALFSHDEADEQKVTFNTLEDLEVQYTAAQDALDNPLQLFIGQMIHQIQAERATGAETSASNSTVSSEAGEDELMKKKKRLFNIEQEAQKKWWECEDSFEDMEAVADYLRSQYTQKTIYEIFDAQTDDAKQEVLSAFWRRRGSKHIDFGDESWIENNLYVNPDGTLELHHWDELYSDRKNIPVTGALEHYRDVAMVDQVVKWIRQETEVMRAVREKWQKNGLAETQLVECTLVQAIDQSLSDSAQEEINDLPKWFFDALNQEARHYRKLPIEYVPERSIDDLLFSLPSLEGEHQLRNLLKGYFIRSQHNLTRYRGLLTTPEELYNVLGLDSSATYDQVRNAYRQVAKKTQAIHISSSNKFDEETWTTMNRQFIEATRAYKALTKHRTGDARITTLGRISSYFESE